jgi:hypothetical protein
MRIACPWYKPNNNQVSMVPDYYVQTSDEWLVFPHELTGLTPDELLNSKAELKEISHLFV